MARAVDIGIQLIKNVLTIQWWSVGINVKRVNIVWRLIEKVASFIQGYIRRNKDRDWKRGS
jgi:hypothetical protein